MPQIAISGDQQQELLNANIPPKKVCSRIRQEFVDCMFRHSECIKKGNKTLPECIRLSKDKEQDDYYPFPSECHKSFNSFLQCRKQIFDNRTRFRGYKEF